MRKKVYDIIPPKLAKKIEQDIREYFEEERAKMIKLEKKIKEKKEKKVSWRVKVALSCSLVIIFLCLSLSLYFYFKLPKADIIIWPNLKILSFQEDIISDKNSDLTDINKKVIPAYFLEVSRDFEESFPASGNVKNEGFASGMITVYNKIDPPIPLTLRAGTHFISDSGKLFRAPEKITIPAAQKSGGKIVPGSVKVKVVATESGEKYNIPPSNFSVPGLKGTPYYYSIYAVSEEPMKGGYSSEKKKVVEADISEAKEILSRKAVEQILQDLKNQYSNDYIILEENTNWEVLNAESDKKPGDVADNFNYKISVKASVLSFKNSELEEYVKKYLVSQISAEKTILDSSIKVNYKIEKADWENKKLFLKVDFSGGVYRSINKNYLSLSLRGKDSQQISETINALLGQDYSKLSIEFWPFWVKKAPTNQKAINIILNFE